jgi:hypothetical protein
MTFQVGDKVVLTMDFEKAALRGYSPFLKDVWEIVAICDDVHRQVWQTDYMITCGKPESRPVTFPIEEAFLRLATHEDLNRPKKRLARIVRKRK